MDVVLFMLFKKRKDLNLKLDKLIYTLEKSNIEDLLSILGSKKKIIARKVNHKNRINEDEQNKQGTKDGKGVFTFMPFYLYAFMC